MIQFIIELNSGKLLHVFTGFNTDCDLNCLFSTNTLFCQKTVLSPGGLQHPLARRPARQTPLIQQRRRQAMAAGLARAGVGRCAHATYATNFLPTTRFRPVFLAS
jgi:hypothetical protein